MIAIADHNEISNVELAMKLGAESGLLVIPSVERTTNEGHLLCYLPNHAQLSKFYAGLDTVDKGLPTSRCQQSLFECLSSVQTLGGFGILARLDTGSVDTPLNLSHSVNG